MSSDPDGSPQVQKFDGRGEVAAATAVPWMPTLQTPGGTLKTEKQGSGCGATQWPDMEYGWPGTWLDLVHMVRPHTRLG